MGAADVFDGGDLTDALGDNGALVYLAGRLVALNADGTRAAYHETG